MYHFCSFYVTVNLSTIDFDGSLIHLHFYHLQLQYRYNIVVWTNTEMWKGDLMQVISTQIQDKYYPVAYSQSSYLSAVLCFNAFTNMVHFVVAPTVPYVSFISTEHSKTSLILSNKIH